MKYDMRIQSERCPLCTFEVFGGKKDCDLSHPLLRFSHTNSMFGLSEPLREAAWEHKAMTSSRLTNIFPTGDSFVG